MASKKILFVCTGNSCRSVMAHYVLKRILEKAGIADVSVSSAGVYALEGMEPTRETQSVLRANNVDCSDHRARPLRPEMVQEADLIFAMEPFHLEAIVSADPSAAGRAYLLKPYGLAHPDGQDQPSIPDPIGKPLEVYEVCFAEIREALLRVAKGLGVGSE